MKHVDERSAGRRMRTTVEARWTVETESSSGG